MIDPSEILRQVLFKLPPERAHRLALNGLSLARTLRLESALFERVERPIKLCGLECSNPVGLAAGYDKDGEYVEALAAMGFGFVEVGTVTPKPQSGNPRPRLFRVPAAQALINRMGFNNRGVDDLVGRLAGRSLDVVLGINIGKNATTPLDEAPADYAYCFERAYASADYITINISSPNTTGLRDLQAIDRLRELLETLIELRQKRVGRGEPHVPLLVKLAPDGDTGDIVEAATTAREIGADGIIATNTTVARNGVEAFAEAREKGGMSGLPLHRRALAVVSALSEALGRDFPLIASGGIVSVEHALRMRDAGAHAVQLYTGLVYRGPRLIADIARRF